MPYIQQPLRPYLELPHAASCAGELNYAICSLLIDYIDSSSQGLCYQTLNDCIGALEGAKAEFQRRVVNPYEDSKIKQNGDLQWPKLETKD